MKKILPLFCVSVFVSSAVFAQNSKPSPTPNLYTSTTIRNLKRIQQMALKSDYAYRQTAYITNNIGPRLTGSPQAARAIEYVSEEMKKLGLKV